MTVITNLSSKNRITRIYLDKQNQVLWVGTFGRGLLKLNLLGDNVNRIQLDNDIRSLNGIAEDSNGFIWLATDNKGIYKSQTKKPLAKYTVRTMGKSGKERQLLLVQRQKRTPVVWR